MLHLSNEGRLIISQYTTKQDIVIIAPLNWGLGHASRCIPLIQFLKHTSKNVIIASDGAALDLLKMEFPELMYVKLPSYNIRYKFESMVANILLHFPILMSAYFKETKMADEIVMSTGATTIISDNRFGFRSHLTKNYYITHQVNILHSNQIISLLASKIHQWLIKKFDLCFIPDYENGRALSGILSTSKSLSKKAHIGPLTRIINLHSEKIWDICVLMSGPEPQRSILESKLLQILNLLTTYKILFIRGVKEKKDLCAISEHVKIEHMITSEHILIALNTSRLLISRSGYSTLMDIEKLDIKAIFIPTPGQTEQEYLAKQWSEKSSYSMVRQDQISALPFLIKNLLN